MPLGCRLRHRVGVAALDDRRFLCRDLETGRVEQCRRREVDDSFEAIRERPIDQQFHGAQIFTRDFSSLRSGDRERDAQTGKVPAVGNTVDLENATWTNSIGATEQTNAQFNRLLKLAKETQIDGKPAIEREDIRQRLSIFIEAALAAQP